MGAHPGSAINNQLTQAAAQAGLPLKLRIQVTSYDALCLMVNAGLGVGSCPGSAALYKGTLGIRTITLNEPWAHRHLKLCVRRKNLSPAWRACWWTTCACHETPPEALQGLPPAPCAAGRTPPARRGGLRGGLAWAAPVS